MSVAAMEGADMGSGVSCREGSGARSAERRKWERTPPYRTEMVISCLRTARGLCKDVAALSLCFVEVQVLNGIHTERTSVVRVVERRRPVTRMGRPV